MSVSSEYFNVLGLDLVRGRGFTQAERVAGRSRRGLFSVLSYVVEQQAKEK